MNIEQIKKDWEQHCKEYGFKSDIDHNSNGCLYLTTKEHSQGVIKIFRRINELVFTNLKNGYSEEQYKLFTTFYTKLMEQDNE
ncbi:MAG: hypothetical protein Unbinned6284contig1004_46 [Prokaryotic dsDNA virus sp.]|nr:MAG: hypothetical protein Unbinned6284contig1004_46 [Prokaryotic dsDNA virus sp.]